VRQADLDERDRRIEVSTFFLGARLAAIWQPSRFRAVRFRPTSVDTRTAPDQAKHRRSDGVRQSRQGLFRGLWVRAPRGPQCLSRSAGHKDLASIFRSPLSPQTVRTSLDTSTHPAYRDMARGTGTTPDSPADHPERSAQSRASALTTRRVGVPVALT
jgi:hypothetical protein